MVETIVPVVHGGKRSSYRLAVALHVLGATIAAAALGAALGLAGMALGAPWDSAGLLALAAVAALYALREGAGLPLPLPDRHRQVPDWWRTFFSPPAAAFLYGLGLGVGFLTFLSFGTFVAVATGALVSGDPLLGAAVCAPFGLARGLSVLVTRRATSAESAARVVDRLEAGANGRCPGSPTPSRCCAVAVVALPAAALAPALGSLSRSSHRLSVCGWSALLTRR